MRILSSILLFHYAALLSGQTDQQAVKILDKFSNTALSAQSVYISFRIKTVDQANGTADTASGSLVMSKDQYRLEMPDNITWYNGTTSWNLLKAEKEVTVTKPDKKDNSFINRPSSVFTIYRKGYKIRLVEEKAASYIVDLYPEDVKSDLVRIRLAINNKSYALENAEYKRKDGVVIILDVTSFNLRTKSDPSAYTFDEKQYRGYDIIDMR